MDPSEAEWDCRIAVADFETCGVGSLASVESASCAACEALLSSLSRSRSSSPIAPSRIQANGLPNAPFSSSGRPVG